MHICAYAHKHTAIQNTTSQDPITTHEWNMLLCSFLGWNKNWINILCNILILPGFGRAHYVLTTLSGVNFLHLAMQMDQTSANKYTGMKSTWICLAGLSVLYSFQPNPCLVTWHTAKTQKQNLKTNWRVKITKWSRTEHIHFVWKL